MAKPVFKITLDKSEKGQGCSWISISVEDTANSQSKKRDARGFHYMNMLAFYGVEAVKLDDGRVSVFQVYRQGREEVRRNSALRRQIEAAVKAFLA